MLQCFDFLMAGGLGRRIVVPYAGHQPDLNHGLVQQHLLAADGGAAA